MEIIREDPPARTRVTESTGRYTEIAEKLKADPDNWYKVAEGLKSANLVGQINTGSLGAFRPKGDFEATGRKVGDTHTVYARFVGPDPEPEG